MPAKQHIVPANATVDVTAKPTAGVVTYFLDGVSNPGPDIQFQAGATPGSVRGLSIMFTAPDGSTCPVTLKFDGQTELDFLTSVVGAPPDLRDHNFVVAAKAADVTAARAFRTFELTGRMPPKTRASGSK